AFQLFLDRLQPKPPPVAPRDPLELERAVPVFSDDMGEPQEVERLRLVQSTLPPALGRVATELDETRLVWMQGQAVLLHALPQRRQEPLGFAFVLEPDHDIISIAYDDHVAPDALQSPVLRPGVEHV